MMYNLENFTGVLLPGDGTRVSKLGDPPRGVVKVPEIGQFDKN